MKAIKRLSIIGAIVVTGHLTLSAEIPIDPQQLQIKQKALQVKPVVDPNRINRSSPREFTVTSPDMGTRTVRGTCAASGGYRGFALVYEALTDEAEGGTLQLVFVMRDRDMKEMIGPIAMTPKSPKADRFPFIRLHRFPGPQDKFLCIYEVLAEHRHQGYIHLIDPFTKDRFGDPRPIGGRDEDVRISNVRVLPGGESVAIVYNAYDKALPGGKGGIYKGSRYVVIDRDGDQIYRGRPGHRSEDEPMMMAADFDVLPDGQWLMLRDYRNQSSIRAMDPYGVWTAPPKPVPGAGARKPASIETLARDRLLIGFDHGYFAGDHAIFLAASNRIDAIPHPSHETLNFSQVMRLSDDRLMFLYIYGKGREENVLQAQITNFAGRVVKPPQDLMLCGSWQVASAHPWGKPSEIILFVPDALAKTGKFRYLSITE